MYRPISDHGRKVEEFATDLQRQQHIVPQLVSLDTREGADLARLYDIVQYPSVIVSRNTGEVVQVWSGDQLPLMSEVAAYARM